MILGFISGYLTSHPWADFAETWAHYLHIVDTLEMAAAFGLDVHPALAKNGDLDAKVKYALRVVEEAQEKHVALTNLQLPILTMDEFNELLDEYVMRLNWRIAHKLQGFERVFEIEVQPGVFLRHDDPCAADFIRDGMSLHVRNEAPAERFARLMQGHRMQRIHPRQLLPLALDKRPVTVRSGKITIYRAGQDNLIFHDTESAPALDTFDGAEKALLGFLAADQSCIHLFTNDEKLRYVASPRNIHRVDIADTDAILCRAGEVDRGRNRIRDEVAELLAPREARYAAMRASNATALGNAPNAPAVHSDVGDKIASAEDAHHFEAVRRKAMSAQQRQRLEAQAAVLASTSEEDDSDDMTGASVTLDPAELL